LIEAIALTIQVDASHLSMITRPEKVTRLIEEATESVRWQARRLTHPKGRHPRQKGAPCHA
jgi:hypothetical protein